jgi:methyltransferase (TIGR00027 family)
MRANEPSGTAMGVALHRATHQLLDGGRIFADPLAVAIIGPKGATIASQMSDRPDARRWRVFMCGRAAFAEKSLCEAVEKRGVAQLVVLGAGLDTFAYRNPFEGRLSVFEVDHPASQLWKRQSLCQAGIPIPESVRYAAMDLERDDLLAKLDAEGFDQDARTFFICMGLFYYLKLTTIHSIYDTIAKLKGEVVFDYSEPPEKLSRFEQEAIARTQERLAAKGEPFVTYFEPTELHAKLLSLGFAAIEDLDTEAWMTRYGDQEMLADWHNVTGGSNRGAHILFART